MPRARPAGIIAVYRLPGVVIAIATASSAPWLATGTAHVFDVGERNPRPIKLKYSTGAQTDLKVLLP